MVLRPPPLEPMFTTGTRYEFPGDNVAVVDVVRAGEVSLPTGRLVARSPDDPVVTLPEMEAFTVEVAPGRYPVSIAVARWDDPPDPLVPAPLRRGAAARVLVRDEPVISWEMGLRGGEDTGSLSDGEYFGINVDYGTGCFLDVASFPFFERLQEDFERLMQIVEQVIDDEWVLVEDPDSGANVVFFDCGMGAGTYPTWVGRTAGGEVRCFVTELELLRGLTPQLPGQ